MSGPHTLGLDHGKAILANILNLVIQRTSQTADLTAYGNLYSFRRKFITAAGRNADKEQSKELATHKPIGESYSRYDYGFGDLYATEIRLGEEQYALIGRVLIQYMFRRAVLLFHRDLTPETQRGNSSMAPILSAEDTSARPRKANYVTMKVFEDESVILAEEAIIDIMDIIPQTLGSGEQSHNVA